MSPLISQDYLNIVGCHQSKGYEYQIYFFVMNFLHKTDIEQNLPMSVCCLI